MATPERDWPDNKKDYRDEAAEKMKIAAETLDKVVNNPPGDIHEVILQAARARIQISDSLRWMERAGAPTTPARLF
jgi:hypothetical protein